MKTIRKCLMIYISLALVLVGMAGAAYAVTASEADEYVTRARYVVDMEYLQNKLDETELTLMGKINKYRSTSVKFVTYDTPNKYDTNTGGLFTGGHHTGGNYFPKTRYNNGSFTYIWGTTNDAAQTKDAAYRVYYINRIWNGNFYFTNATFFSDEGSTANWYIGCFNYALPVENLPGWYVVLKAYYHDNSVVYYGSLVKLDPNVAYGDVAAIANMDLRLRLKKNLFVYSSDTTTRYPKKLQKSTGNASRLDNQSYHNGLTRSVWNRATTVTQAVESTAWTDEVTGDYMLTLKGMRPCSGTYGFVEYMMGGFGFITRLIPADNVEYIQYATSVYESGTEGYPDARHIGDGALNDPYWKYEFVDCINGIKYWHAHRPATKQQLGTGIPFAVGVHYSLPIVY